MKKIIFISLLLILASTTYSVTIYKWVDKEGVLNFTDDPSKIPSEYRNHVGTEVIEDSQKVETPVPASTSPQGSEGIKRDKYGMGEDYWRNKVRPWHKQLKEAEADIQSVDGKIKEKLNTLSGKFLSRTQHKMYSSGLQQLKDERSKYEARVNQANEMLEKIGKEAEEVGADPDWLK